MAGQFEFAWAAANTKDGVTKTFGSYPQPVKSVNTTGDYELAKSVVIPVTSASHPYPDPSLVWSYLEGAQSFSSLIFQVRAEGFLWLSWLVDSPTSSSDFTPTGTRQKVHNIGLSCYTPFIMNTQQALVHATLATAAGLDGSGFPSILTSATSVAGRVYKVWARNTSTTVAATLDVWGVN